MEAAAASGRVGEQKSAGSPYLGLSFYTEEVAELFFGRDSERSLIIGNLRAARLTILYAPSGVGKSSLLHAGVAARLRQLANRGLTERGSASLIPVVFASWRDEPVDELIDQIERAIQPFTNDGPVELPRGSLEGALESANAATGATLVLLLDQFEEYFLYGGMESEPGRFADQLARCINRPELAANFLIALREDAYAGVGDLFRGKISNPYANNFSLEYLDRRTGRDAITKPVDYYNAHQDGAPPMRIEPDLVDAVLDQVRTGQVAFDHQGAGAVAGEEDVERSEDDRIETPYLQLVMTALWDRERRAGSEVLRVSTLEELGGAQAIVRSHLDRAMSELPDEERETAVDVFNHLVTPSGTKIVHTVEDLAEYGGREPAQVHALIEKLSSGDQRILRPVPPAPGDDRPRVEIFHDVLAPAILAWRAAQTSVRLERERQEAEDRANLERRRARTFRAVAGVAFTLLLVAVVAVILARVESNRAHTAERQALSRELAAQSVSDLQHGALGRGVLLSIQAFRYARTADARSSLIRAQEATQSMAGLLSGHTADVTSVAYSPDGRLIASGGADNQLLLQDVSSGRTMRVLRTASTVTSVAFAPDGRRLASGLADGRIVLWNPADGSRQRVLGSRASHGVYALAFDRAGKLLASGNANGTVVVSDAATGATLRSFRPGRGSVASVAFSPDGRTLAVGGSSKVVTLWSVASGRLLRRFTGHRKAVNAVAFSPDGTILASGSDDRTVILWDAATGRRLRALTGHTNFVNALAFSPDGSMLASAGADRHVLLWSVATGRLLQTLLGHSAAIEAVAFSPSGATLASGADDDQVIVWNARPTLLERVLPAGGPVLAEAYSPDGRLIATAQSSGPVLLWDVATERQVGSFTGHRGAVETLAFSPNGATLASGGTDHTLILWNVRTGARERTLRGHTDTVYNVAFSPDGRRLASASADDTVILWNAATGAREHTLRGHTDFVYGVAFSHSGRLLASASADQSVILWGVTSGRRLRALTAHTAAVETVSFSPNDQMLASGSDDGTVILSDPATGRALGDPLNAASGVLSVAFSPNGRLLASGGNGKGVLLWDLRTRLAEALPGHPSSVLGVAFSPDSRTLASASLDQTVQLAGPLPARIDADAVDTRLCGIVRRNLLRSEWNEFLPGQPYERTCGNA